MPKARAFEIQIRTLPRNSARHLYIVLVIESQGRSVTRGQTGRNGGAQRPEGLFLINRSQVAPAVVPKAPARPVAGLGQDYRAIFRFELCGPHGTNTIAFWRDAMRQ